jgi:hypothetical protein
MSVFVGCVQTTVVRPESSLGPAITSYTPTSRRNNPGPVRECMHVGVNQLEDVAHENVAISDSLVISWGFAAARACGA